MTYLTQGRNNKLALTLVWQDLLQNNWQFRPWDPVSAMKSSDPIYSKNGHLHRLEQVVVVGYRLLQLGTGNFDYKR